MRMNEIIWVTSRIGYGAVPYYMIIVNSDHLTFKQRRAVKRWLDLDGMTFKSFRLAQDIVNMARNQMKEKLQ